MKILTTESSQEAARLTAQIILERIEGHPRSVLGLATGKTMEPVYKALAQEAERTHQKFTDCSFFMLDEYLDLERTHFASFESYIRTRVMSPLSLKEGQIFFPPAHERDIEAAALGYEQQIRSLGGVDLQLLGIGKNGHIGFNEPGSLKHSRTRKVELTDSTREANRSDFNGGDVPKFALSMGIGTILEAKSLLMLATGKSKADAVKYLLNHHDDPSCPATFLKGHPHFTLVLDPEAASKINLNI